LWLLQIDVGLRLSPGATVRSLGQSLRGHWGLPSVLPADLPQDPGGLHRYEPVC